MTASDSGEGGGLERERLARNGGDGADGRAAEQHLVGHVAGRAAERCAIRTPAVAVAEAKEEDIIGGFGQCAVGMVAARLINQRAGDPPRPVFGVVTPGTVWTFLRPDGDTLRIDVPEYDLPDVGKILGVLVHRLSA